MLSKSRKDRCFGRKRHLLRYGLINGGRWIGKKLYEWVRVILPLF